MTQTTGRQGEFLPRTIGPYRLETVIGSGGMGEVYRAYDLRLERRVAIKHIHPDREPDANARRRLRREARAAAALAHPSIVQVFDILEEDDGEWIVMELIDGPSLARRLEEGPLAIAATIGIAHEIATGLASAHAQGLVHRDLKTENVMISSFGQAKILDFGLAKRVTPQSDRDLARAEESLTEVGSVVGTSRAMSPEQAQGYKVGAKSDLFSLGVLIYECLTGRSPFKADSAMATLTRVCTHRQKPVRDLNSETPEDLARLVDRLLEKLPEMRPRSARHTADELAAIGKRFEQTTSNERRESAGESETIDFVAAGDTQVPSTEEAREGVSGQRKTMRRVAAAALAAAALLALVSGLPGVQRMIPDNVTKASLVTAGSLPNGPRAWVGQGLELLRFSYRENHVERAIELFEDALRITGPDARALAGLCEAYAAKYIRGRDPLWLNRAAEHARLAVELEAQLARARACLADVLLAQERNEEALREIDEAVLLKPLSADYHARRGMVLFAMQNYEEALSTLARAIEVDPESWHAHERLGYVELRLAKNEAAVSSLARAAHLAPDHPVIHKNLGAAYFRLGRHDEAAMELQRSLEIEPYHSTYTNLGTLEFYRGRYLAALAAFEKAVQSGAHHYLNWANLGDAQRFTPGLEEAASESFKRAIQLLEEDLARRPRDPELRSRLALYRAKQGATEKTRGELAALDLEQAESPQVLYRAAQAFEIIGQRQRALEVLESALESGLPLAEVRHDPELTELRQDALFHRLAVRHQ